MRCQQARNRLSLAQTEPDKLHLDLELMAHIDNCPACQLHLEADQSLKAAFTKLSEQETKPAPFFEAMITRVEALSAESSLSPSIDSETNKKSKGNIIMSKIVKQFSQRPSMSLSIGLVGILLIVSMLVPFTYQDSIGYEVAFAGVDKNLALDEGKLSDILLKLGIEDAVIDVTGCEATCNVTISEIPSPDDAKMVMIAFETMGNAELVDQPKVIFETKDGNVFTTVLHGMVKDAHENLVYFSEDDDNGKLHEIVIDRLGESFGIWITKAGEEGELIDCNDGDKQIRFISECTDGAPGEQAKFEFFTSDGNVIKGSSALHEIIGDDGNVVMFKSISNGKDCNLNFNAEAGGMSITMTAGELEQSVIDELRAAGVTVEIIDDLHEVREYSDDEESAAKESSLPEGYTLSQNYPNPFNPETQIDFSLGQASQVTLEIFNIKGQMVATLVDDYMSAGQHSVSWDATNSSGQPVATGIYLYRLQAGDVTTTRKMNFIK